MTYAAPRPVFARKPATQAELVARNLRRLRFQRGLTLEKLAELAGINLLTLFQMEDGKREPDLALVWKAANALSVPFSALIAEGAPHGTVVLRKDRTRVLVSESRALASRALFLPEELRRTEFYELKLAPMQKESSHAHLPGTSEMLHVAQGALEVSVGRDPPYLVNKGDTIIFPADLDHSYRNLTDLPAILYLVMTYEAAA